MAITNSNYSANMAGETDVGKVFIRGIPANIHNVLVLRVMAVLSCLVSTEMLRFNGYGVTDSPLCRGCMETEETASHVMLECNGVAPYRAKHLGTPRDLPEVLLNIKGLTGFLEELGWQD